MFDRGKNAIFIPNLSTIYQIYGIQHLESNKFISYYTTYSDNVQNYPYRSPDALKYNILKCNATPYFTMISDISINNNIIAIRLEPVYYHAEFTSSNPMIKSPAYRLNNKCFNKKNKMYSVLIQFLYDKSSEKIYNDHHLEYLLNRMIRTEHGPRLFDRFGRFLSSFSNSMIISQQDSSSLPEDRSLSGGYHSQLLLDHG